MCSDYSIGLPSSFHLAPLASVSPAVVASGGYNICPRAPTTERPDPHRLTVAPLRARAGSPCLRSITRSCRHLLVKVRKDSRIMREPNGTFFGVDMRDG